MWNDCDLLLPCRSAFGRLVYCLACVDNVAERSTRCKGVEGIARNNEQGLPGVCGGDGVGLHVQDDKVLNGVGMPLTGTILQPDRIPILQLPDVNAVAVAVAGEHRCSSLAGQNAFLVKGRPECERLSRCPGKHDLVHFVARDRQAQYGDTVKTFPGTLVLTCVDRFVPGVLQELLGDTGLQLNLKGLETKISPSQQQRERQEKNGESFQAIRLWILKR